MKVAVIGASGYVGAELIALLCGHDKISLNHLVVSEHSSSAEKTFSELHPKYAGICDLPLTPFSAQWLAQAAGDLDAVFFATPHEFSATWAQAFIEYGVKVFDLSGGFRLKKLEDYPTYYEFEHQYSELLDQAVYGLAEWQAEEIKQTNLVAVPGCYPTASLLSLKPITHHQLHKMDGLIVVNGVSGVSGAGRKASLATSFNEVSLTPYNILQHRHQPEISQEAGASVIFNPHLAPYKRGLLVTITLQLKADVTEAQVKQAYLTTYQDKPLVRLVDTWPKVDNVAHTPFADVHWKYEQDQQVLVVSCAIDNLLKGAASQAIQCANISLGLASDYGLINTALRGSC
ncbi:N-acetyl-gamma-glutamyl-phosphate reductase [Thalassotalea sp. G2M2-11]|uniref:N-acetyl-gamma-glutamyl-phosphate reductase n=1 Tax=Thalassotalea sp. G2M2-11 TaxID=2787627 RepID=UPI0019D19D0D|nr:N-acetyl-gamma-glutamyl-phosphate reductase [Thalassotalea sp. G2M2-11]